LPHAEDGADIRLTFDPSLPLHTITLAGPAPWPVAPTFEIWFEGVQPNSVTQTAMWCRLIAAGSTCLIGGQPAGWIAVQPYDNRNQR